MGGWGFMTPTCESGGTDQRTGKLVLLWGFVYFNLFDIIRFEITDNLRKDPL